MYENQTPEAIKAAALGALKSDLDRREGSFADDMAGPLALELYKMYQALNAVQPIVWVDETSGRYLDLAAADIGIELRKSGTKAAAMLELSGTPRHLIAAGTVFGTVDGILFETTEPVRLSPEGTASVKAQAQQIGTEGNVEAESIVCQFQNDSRIKTVQNPMSAQGGTDPESDTALYARIEDARQKPANSGCKNDYERWAREVDGVGFSKCTPVQYGAGTVGVLIANEDRRPVDEAIVTACAAHIELVRPVGAAVTVKSAEPLLIDVAAQVTLDEGALIETVQQNYTTTLDAYLQKLAFREYTVRHNRIGALLIGIDGVKDYSVLTLNGAQESVTIGAEQVAFLGEVTLTCT